MCLVLLGLGLCGTLLHLGQPLRFVNGMANPGSMIAQEAYWSIAFGAVIVVDLAVAKAKGAAVRPIRWAGGLVAVGLMVVTGLAYYQSLGLPAWSGAATVPLFLVGDLALGAGLCALLDRLFYSCGSLLAYKPAAAVAVCRRGGASATFDRLNKYFTISNMPVVSSQYWNSVHGRLPGEAAQDAEGLQTMRVLARNMARVLRAGLLAGEGRPEPEERVATSFIR